MIALNSQVLARGSLNGNRHQTIVDGDRSQRLMCKQGIGWRHDQIQGSQKAVANQEHALNPVAEQGHDKGRGAQGWD